MHRTLSIFSFVAIFVGCARGPSAGQQDDANSNSMITPDASDNGDSDDPTDEDPSETEKDPSSTDETDPSEDDPGQGGPAK